jgi:hypothetical protein
MKGIGIFVLLLVVGLGVAMYFVTRPPDRTLDPAERAWVARFSDWRSGMVRSVDRADVSIGVSTRSLSSALTAPLRTCAVTLEQVGEPPGLLDGVVDDASAACGEIEHALAVNLRFGGPALATTKLHFRRAESWLRQARINMQQELEPSGS